MNPSALVTCQNLLDFSGAEITTLDISDELKRLGYNVTISSFFINDLFLKLIEDKGHIYKNIRSYDTEFKYDLAWLHHHTTAHELLLNNKIKFNNIIYSSLSPFEPLESPPLTNTDIDLYVVNSQENYDNFLQNYTDLASKLFLFENSAPENYWNIRSNLGEIQKVAVISNHIPSELENACNELKKYVRLDTYGINHTLKLIDKNILYQYNAVITIGKTVHYCLALGIPVYNYDHFGGDGWITSENYERNRYYNFSGRGSRGRVLQDKIVEEILNKQNISQSDIENIRLRSKKHFCLTTNITKALHLIGKTRIKLNSFSKTKSNILSNINRNAIKNREITNNAHYSLDLNLKKIEYLNHKLHSAYQEINTKSDEIESISKALTSTTKENNALKHQIARSNDKISHLNSKVKAYENSKSWKITKPIRIIVQWKNEMLNTIKLKISWMKFLLSRSYLVIKHQGVAAFLKKSKNYINGWLRRKTAPSYKLRSSAKKTLTNSPLVSFIIPVYDRTDILRSAIESALNQTYPNIEVIIVTDGSPKETIDVVNEFIARDNVKVFNYPISSGNAVRGRNKGLIEANGKYIAFLDSDDIASPDRIELSLPLLESGEADVVYGAWEALLDGSRAFKEIKNGQIAFSPDTDFDALLESCVPCQSTVTLRKELINKYGALNTKMQYREDHELWVRLAYNGARFKSIPRVLTKLRLHEGNNELNFQDDDKVWKNELITNYKTKPKKIKKIAFILPGVGVSGGIAVVFKHAKMLLEAGHDAFVINIGEPGDGGWFADNTVPIIHINDSRSYLFNNIDMLFATGWNTAEWLEKFDAKRKLYFVQSDERRFFDDEALKNKIHNTYRMDCEYLTEAYWIQKMLSDEFGHNAHYVPNGLDQDIFYPMAPLKQKSGKVRVLIEGPIIIPFKGMKDCYEAIKDLDCEIWIVSSAGRPPADWKYDEFFERVPFNMMPQIYSSCDIFLKMSRVEGFFGPPMEAMACGCSVVVGKVTGYDEYIKHEYNALVIDQGDVKAARNAVQLLIDNKDLREILIKNGRSTIQQWTWESSLLAMDSLINKQ